MPRPPDERRRRELLDALIEAFASGGVGGRSLRDVAAAAGTSHRMLLHHFGSRDELLLAIVEEVERRQAATLGDLPDDPAGAFLAMWADVRRPELRPFERLFFECYARGAQGEEPFTRLLPAAVDDWLSSVDAQSGPAVDRATVRLGLAVTRGLLLDLVATGDEEGVDAAAERFAGLLAAARSLAPRRGARTRVSSPSAGRE
jgi:AcrR family transcriptional regulator